MIDDGEDGETWLVGNYICYNIACCLNNDICTPGSLHMSTNISYTNNGILGGIHNFRDILGMDEFASISAKRAQNKQNNYLRRSPHHTSHLIRKQMCSWCSNISFILHSRLGVGSVVSLLYVLESVRRLNIFFLLEPSVQFTVELESEGKLPFLDVLLQRDPDGSISTAVYRKATHVDRYLDFMSHHPLAHKPMVAKILHVRAEAICSGVTAKDQETRHIRQALINNGYPRGVLQHYATPAPTRPADNHSRGLVITLPYVRGLSEAVWRVLTPQDWGSLSTPTPPSNNY